MKQLDKKGWKAVRFGDVCRNLNVTVKSPAENGYDKVIGLENIDSGNLHIKTWGDIADGTTFTKTFEPGHVLFGKRRAYLKKAAVAEFKGLCSGDILVFEANAKVIHPKLLPFIVSSDRFFDYAIKTSAGSLSPRTKFQDLANFEFSLPPIDQQEKLAELLWAGNYLIFKYNELNNCIYTTRRELVNEYTNYRLNNFQFYNHTIGEILSESENTKAEFIDKEKLITVRLHIKGVERNISTDGLKIGSTIYYHRKAGDFIYGKQNLHNGALGIIPTEFDSFLSSQDVPSFEINKNKIMPEYLLEFFSRVNFYKSLEKYSAGSGSKRISFDRLSKVEIMLPELDVQQDLIKRLSIIDQRSIQTNQIINQLKCMQLRLINEIIRE